MMDIAQKMPIKWSTRHIETFLDAYRKHRCLWDFEDTNYVWKPARQAALQSILDEMAIPGMDLEELKRKIHSIRNTYTNERRKIEKSKKTAPCTENHYKPRIKWFYIADKFLRKIVASRKDRMASVSKPFIASVTAVNLQSLLQDASPVQQFHSPEEEYDATCSLSGVSVSPSESFSRSRTALEYEPTVSNNFRDSHLSLSGGPSSHQTIRTVAPATIMRNVPPTCTTIAGVQCKQESSDLETINDSLHDQTTEMISFQRVDEDELEVFARSVLLQMRRLPEEYNIELMAEIQRLISEKRKEYLWSKK